MSSDAASGGTVEPPDPVFEDGGRSGLAVWVNAGYVEVSGPEFSRLTPGEAVALLPAFAAAITEAAGWARCWNRTTRKYQNH